MIVVATSNANQCQYCVIAHGAILRIRAKDPLISDQVAINYRKADITERQKAMLDFALKVSRSAESAGEADFDVLKSHGFDEEDIWDIAGIAAFFALSNRGERDRDAPQRRILHHGPRLAGTIATCSRTERSIGLEFDRDVDQLVVWFAALPLSAAGC